MTKRRKPSPDDLPTLSELVEGPTPRRSRRWEVTLVETTQRTFVIDARSEPEGAHFSIGGPIIERFEEDRDSWAEIALLSDD